MLALGDHDRLQISSSKPPTERSARVMHRVHSAPVAGPSSNQRGSRNYSTPVMITDGPFADRRGPYSTIHRHINMIRSTTSHSVHRSAQLLVQTGEGNATGFWSATLRKKHQQSRRSQTHHSSWFEGSSFTTLGSFVFVGVGVSSHGSNTPVPN